MVETHFERKFGLSDQSPEALKRRVFKPRVCLWRLNWTFLREKKKFQSSHCVKFLLSRLRGTVRNCKSSEAHAPCSFSGYWLLRTSSLLTCSTIGAEMFRRLTRSCTCKIPRHRSANAFLCVCSQPQDLGGVCFRFATNCGHIYSAPTRTCHTDRPSAG